MSRSSLYSPPPAAGRLAALGAVVILAGLGGCADPDEKTGFAPACPQIGITPHAAERLDWGTGRTAEPAHLKDVVYLARAAGSCAYKRHHPNRPFMTRVSLAASFIIAGGPDRGDVARGGKSKDDANGVPIPYYVAIMRDGKILDKKIFEIRAPLPTEGQSHGAGAPVRFIDLPTGDDPQRSDYRLEIGLQLTRDQLEYNREHRATTRFVKQGLD